MPGNYLDGREAHLAQALRRMVKIATVNPPGRDYLSMVEHLRDRLRVLDMRTTVHRVPDAEVADAGVDPSFPRYNVVARWDVGAGKTVHFNAHYDVVPVAEMPRPLVGMVNAVAIDPETGTFVGGAEIRMDGHVSGY